MSVQTNTMTGLGFSVYHVLYGSALQDVKHPCKVAVAISSSIVNSDQQQWHKHQQ